MKNLQHLPAVASPQAAVRQGLLGRILGQEPPAEPVSMWRAAPEAALRALGPDEKEAYLDALLPLLHRSGRAVQPHLRRLYQLFAFMEMPAASRRRILARLQAAPRFAPEAVPDFRKAVRFSLIEEAVSLAGRAPSAHARRHIARLRLRLRVKSSDSAKLTRLFEKLTDFENRAATLLGKRGHVVRLPDRRREVFKKGVAAVGVPAAVLFPLGTLGLSAEGITSGLVALGGGFLLPAGVAMATGLGAAVAIGITTKKVLDMLLPTIDADRASIDVQQMKTGLVEIQRVLEAGAGTAADSERVSEAQGKIAEIMRRLAPMSEAERARVNAALQHERILGDRYLSYLEEDQDALGADNEGRQLGALHDLDLPAITRA